MPCPFLSRGKVIASRVISLAKHSESLRGVNPDGHFHAPVREATIVDVIGDITLYNLAGSPQSAAGPFEDKKAPRVIVNLEKVQYIDSAGVASLVEGLKVSRDLKSTFALYGLSRTAREVLELTRLIKVFEVYNTEEEALRGGSTNVAPAVR